MEIHKFLNNYLQDHKQFHAIIISIDIEKSRSLLGSDDDKSKTKASLRNLINELMGSRPMAILDWRGDGGILIGDTNGGFDDFIQYCDLLVGIIPVFNRSRQILNCLPYDMIHIRIVCNCALLNNTGDPGILSKAEIDNMFGEKEVGITDHVVVTQNIYNQLQPYLKSRFTLLDSNGSVLDPCYILDGNKGLLTIENNKGTSEELRRWIVEMSLKHDFDELIIFSYTNESLYQYLPTEISKLKIRILMRDWLTEKRDETIYNLMNQKMEKSKTPTGLLKRKWEKAHTIKSISDQLLNIEDHPCPENVEVRFYNQKPLLKGAILKSRNILIGYIGFYCWDPNRKEGGSPYIGENWPSFCIVEKSGSNNKLLELFLTRFEELWNNGRKYEELIIDENSQDYTYEKNIENIFSVDGSKYLIVYPGVPQEGRLLPEVASEDMSGAFAIKDLLEDHGNKVKVEVIINNVIPKTINNWDGHIIAFCHRSLLKEMFPDINLELMQYRIIFDENKKPKLYISDFNNYAYSPIDYDIPQHRDYCLITKLTRSNGKKIILVAGLHAIGTWGGAIYLVNKNNLSDLACLVKDKDFSIILDCPFSIPDREIFPKILHGPIY